MSVYTQEVLGLLKRNKKKRELDKIRDHFEFGKLYQNSSLNTGAAYNPRMEPFVIKWGDFKCATEEGMVRQDPTGTQERYITMWTDPVFQGDCQILNQVIKFRFQQYLNSLNHFYFVS